MRVWRGRSMYGGSTGGKYDRDVGRAGSNRLALFREAAMLC